MHIIIVLFSLNQLKTVTLMLVDCSFWKKYLWKDSGTFSKAMTASQRQLVCWKNKQHIFIICSHFIFVISIFSPNLKATEWGPLWPSLYCNMKVLQFFILFFLTGLHLSVRQVNGKLCEVVCNPAKFAFFAFNIIDFGCLSFCVCLWDVQKEH